MAAGDIADALWAMSVTELQSIGGAIRAANTRLDHHQAYGTDSGIGRDGWDIRPSEPAPHLHVLEGEGWEAQIEHSYKEGWDIDIFTLQPNDTIKDVVFKARHVKTLYEAKKIAEMVVKERFKA